MPSWLLAAAVLVALAIWLGVSTGLCAAIFAVIVIKDFAAYPFVRSAYAVAPPTGTARLVGTRGTAQSRLDPGGYVRVGSELWKAKLAEGEPAIEAGGNVEVVDAKGLMLVVAAPASADE